MPPLRHWCRNNYETKTKYVQNQKAQLGAIQYGLRPIGLYPPNTKV
ncbi:Hypothetical protein I595_2237 [Croceitalea dokdonensis DOKDO 023]|uniref:Uncharacterized protein n=1 Tax=Croceitalea dokdonensis DOKDO 023 TaxID=1300341 RepID=A0A0P7AV59_9FLAO|nr:Hypothetical protein I595_2237 [Croceitalea dokdonensis DOKDO 023]